MEELKKKIEKLLLKVQRPSRYIGGEVGSVVKDKDKVDVRFAFCFPDTYEVGMSHLGMKILYGLKNARENWWCERVFMPEEDYNKLMRENDIPLYALESLDPIKDFDFIGFTLMYELSYNNVLEMLDLAGLPVLAKDRTELTPLVIAGGPCACNPEPMADFFDLFILGEGEEVNVELLELYERMKPLKPTKQEFLREAAKLEGVYVPSFYDVDYNEDGTVKSITPNVPEAPARVKKRVIKDFDKVYYPEGFVVPFTQIVHDRAMVGTHLFLVCTAPSSERTSACSGLLIIIPTALPVSIALPPPMEIMKSAPAALKAATPLCTFSMVGLGFTSSNTA